jgi:uncharacterized protein (DUF983 family)
MSDANTRPVNVAMICCRVCNKDKLKEEFPKNRRKCKVCMNNIRKQREQENPALRARKLELVRNRLKNDTEFRTKFYEKRKQKYHGDAEFRKKVIQKRVKQKQLIAAQKRLVIQQEQERIGLENKRCKYCNEVKLKERFRHNRLKCKDCERDEPIEKLKRTIRSRIHSGLCSQNQVKNQHTIEYLGCSSNEYLSYLLCYNSSFTLDNRGKEWHIDHVIPLSIFDLNNEDEKLLAFNWRNTMPLSKYDNLAKNNRIIQTQLTQHLLVLEEYHTKNKIEMPKSFIDLFAKHLDAGNSLEPLLPLTNGNICEDLG